MADMLKWDQQEAAVSQLNQAVHSFRDILEAEEPPRDPTYTYDAKLQAPSVSGGKDWSISVKDNHVTTTFGPAGGWQQTKVKTFPTTAAAMKHAHGMVNKKGKKGYSAHPSLSTDEILQGTMPKGKTWGHGAPEPSEVKKGNTKGKPPGMDTGKKKSSSSGLVDVTGDVMKALGAKTATAKAKAKAKAKSTQPDWELAKKQALAAGGRKPLPPPPAGLSKADTKTWNQIQQATLNNLEYASAAAALSTKKKAPKKGLSLSPAQKKALSKSPAQSAADMDKQTAAMKAGAAGSSKGAAPKSHDDLIKSIKSRKACCTKSAEAVAKKIRAKIGGKKSKGKKARRPG